MLQSLHMHHAHFKTVMCALQTTTVKEFIEVFCDLEHKLQVDADTEGVQLKWPSLLSESHRFQIPNPLGLSCWRHLGDSVFLQETQSCGLLGSVDLEDSIVG